MIIDCIGDLHGYYPKLEGGDLLIVAGDLTARDTVDEHDDFADWVESQTYRKIIYIAGNHDNFLERRQYDHLIESSISKRQFLCDSGTEFEGLKIWGSPWTTTFEGMNPHCKAFTVDTEEELAEKWAMIPEDIDILITHSPPYFILDKTVDGRHVGSPYLYQIHCQMKGSKLHVFGHIHESYGMQRPNLGFIDLDGYPIYVNASHVNERYQPVNKPIRVIL